MNKLHKILWSIISGAICILYRSECMADWATSGYCCTRNVKSYKEYTDKTQYDSWLRFCSQAYLDETSSNGYSWVSNYSETLANHVVLHSCPSGTYLSSCITKNGQTIYNITQNEIENCLSTKLFCAKCPYDGTLSSSIIMITGEKSDKTLYFCTTQNLKTTQQGTPTGTNYKLYAIEINCDQCHGETQIPSIGDCYMPKTAVSGTLSSTVQAINSIYENRMGYFHVINTDCHAK